MRREAELRRRLRSLDALAEAVGAMKSLSAHHFRQARAAMGPAHHYREGVDRIARASGATLPAGRGGAGLLVVGAALGLCGSYNTEVVALAAEQRAGLAAGPTFCVGRRAAALLARRGVEITRTFDAPTGVGGITSLLLRLAEEVLTSYGARDLSAFDIVSSHFAAVGSARAETVRLLPFEAGVGPHPPSVRYVGGDSLASAAVREFLYVTLYALLLDAMVCEHGARLLATEAAERWLNEHAAGLRRRLAATRREASTQEVIEIAAGARARAVSIRMPAGSS